MEVIQTHTNKGRGDKAIRPNRKDVAAEIICHDDRLGEDNLLLGRDYEATEETKSEHIPQFEGKTYSDTMEGPDVFYDAEDADVFYDAEDTKHEARQAEFKGAPKTRFPGPAQSSNKRSKDTGETQYVPILINGAPIVYMYDTGANLTYIDLNSV